MDEEEVLYGGVANAGAVVRIGPHVLRPANPYSASIHRFLAALADAGFDGAPRPVGFEPDGRERLSFVEGDVALPPYPPWVQLDSSLASIAALMARFHRASAAFDGTGLAWSDEIADPDGGPLVCHHDVCLENVVFRQGQAAGFLDFDFAAPGRAVVDVAHMARMCVPIDDDRSAALLGWTAADRPARLRLVADAYGLDAGGRLEVMASLDATIANNGAFVRRRVEAGDPNFTFMYTAMGGIERFDRRRRWWGQDRDRFITAMT
jgi:hypothetical protein